MFMRYHCFKTIIVAVILSVSYLFTGDCYSPRLLLVYKWAMLLIFYLIVVLW